MSGPHWCVSLRHLIFLFQLLFFPFLFRFSLFCPTLVHPPVVAMSLDAIFARIDALANNKDQDDHTWSGQLRQSTEMMQQRAIA